MEALEPNVGDHLQRNVEEKTQGYLYITTRNIAVDQGAERCEVITTEKRIDADQLPWIQLFIVLR